LRYYGLNNLSPPGLEHDEVAHWLINTDILEGNHALYFAEAYGHEAGYHYLQTLFMVLLGENAFVLRLPSAFAGILLVAVSFALARRLFGLKTALLSATLLAVLFWPVFYSRLALRAISLPLLSGLSAYFWWQGWMGAPSPPKQPLGDKVETKGTSSDRWWPKLSPVVWFVLAGLFAGLTFYTYMASRVVPIFYLLFAGYLLLFHRTKLKSHWKGVLLFFLVYLVVVAPLALYLLANPGTEARIDEVDAPLRALLSGDLGPAISNSIKILGMFGVRGDPLWRQNVAYLPVFEPIVAVFFYIGLLISLWRWREERHLFLMLWLFTAAIPSIVTIDAPSSIRIINALPILTIIPVIGSEVIQFFRPLSTVSTKLSPKIIKIGAIVVIIALLVIYIGRSTIDLFQVWPKNEEVQFVWQKALTDMASYLDQQEESGAVAIGGWSAESLDPPTMALALRREDLSLRFFDPFQAIIIPAGSPSGHARIAFPVINPIQPDLKAWLEGQELRSRNEGSFETIEIAGGVPFQPQKPAEVIFGDEITLLGYDLLPSEDVAPGNSEGESIQLVTYWQVNAVPNGPPRIFLHAINDGGEIVAQNDTLGAPAEFWLAGDILLQYHELDMVPYDGSLKFHIGFYDPASGRRLLTDAGTDHIPLEIEQAK